LTLLTARRSDALVARVGAARFAELWDDGAALEPGAVRGWFAGRAHTVTHVARVAHVAELWATCG
jgi:hypothetical protein